MRFGGPKAQGYSGQALKARPFKTDTFREFFRSLLAPGPQLLVAVSPHGSVADGKLKHSRE